MARIKLHQGVWTNFGAFVLSGAGAVTGATADQLLLQVIGWAGMMFGLGILVWGVTFEGEHWWHRSRIRMTWPYALIALGMIAVLVGGVFAWRGKAAAVAHQKTAPPAAAEPNASRDVAPIDHPPRFVPLPAQAAGRFTAPQVAVHSDRVASGEIAGRLVIDQPLFVTDNSDPTFIETLVRINNTGPGIAYAGMGWTDFALVGPSGDLDLSPIIERAVGKAEAATPRKTVEIAPNSAFDFPSRLKIPRADFASMIAKEKRLVFVEAYTYVTDATPPNHVEIALLAMIISGRSATTWTMSIERQSTKTYKAKGAK